MDRNAEILKLKADNEKLKSELLTLKSGIDEVFASAQQEYPNIKANSYFEKTRLLGIIFQSIESRKFTLNEQINALDSVSDGIAIFSKTGHLVFHNTSFLKLFNIENPEVKQPHWRTLFKEEHHLKVANELVAELSEKYAVHQEVEFLLNGDAVFFKSSIYPLKNENFLVNIKDVTAEKQKLHKIQEQASLLKSSSELMAVCDLNFEFTFLNDSGRVLLNCEDSCNARSFDSYIEDKSYFEHTIVPKLLSNSSWIGELVVSTNKNTFPARCEIIPFSSSATSLGGFHIVLQDVTDRKKAIRKLIDAKNEAEKNMKVRQEFLANMSHEIRTPMNAIIGLSNLMMDTQLDSDQFEFANSIKLSADNLLVIINDILDLSKIEGGHLVIEQVNFDIKALLNGLNCIFKRKIEGSGVAFKIEVDEQLPKLISGDPTRLNQILMNLLSNADKFTSTGQIDLSVKCNAITNEKVQLTFEVKDTGVGIAKENLSKIFDAFTQESTSTARIYGGTGLGLAIVNQLVNLQNGKIWVESRVKKGTSFFVQLMYNLADHAPVENKLLIKDEFNELLTNAKIIMAEDYPMNQLLANSLFKKWGISLTVVDNGRHLLNEIEKEKYDLILMDIQMPVMDGMETTRILRKQGVKTPIIAITAHAFKEEQNQCLKAGMNDFISKPFDEIELKSKMIGFLTNQEHFEKTILSENSPTEEEFNRTVFSLDYINEMGAGDQGFVKEMLSMFLEQVPSQINSIIKYCNNNEYDNLSKVAHTLQSSFAMLQRKDLKDYLKKVESWSKDQTVSYYPLAEINNIISEAKLVLQAVADYLGDVITFDFEVLDAQPEVNVVKSVEVDFDKIDDLAEGDESFKKQMIELFIMQTTEQVVHLNIALSENDFAKIGGIAHNMIPSYDLINANELNQYARRVESVCKESNDSYLKREITINYIEETEKAIDMVKEQGILIGLLKG